MVPWANLRIAVPKAQKVSSLACKRSHAIRVPKSNMFNPKSKKKYFETPMSLVVVLLLGGLTTRFAWHGWVPTSSRASAGLWPMFASNFWQRWSTTMAQKANDIWQLFNRPRKKIWKKPDFFALDAFPPFVILTLETLGSKTCCPTAVQYRPVTRPFQSCGPRERPLMNPRSHRGSIILGCSREKAIIRT